MENPNKFHVFISYHSSDTPWVLRLKNALEVRRLRVWLDKDEIRPGDLFAKALESGLKASKSIILVVTPNSMKSKWVDEEYYRALSLSKGRKQPARLIPVVLNMAKLPGFLESRNWVDFRNEAEFEKNIDKLVWGITGKKETQPNLHEKKQSDEKSLADSLFSEAIKLNFDNYPLKALQKFRQVKRIHPGYPEIDFWIQKLEKEVERNIIDPNGRVSFERLRVVASIGILFIIAIFGVKSFFQYRSVIPTLTATTATPSISPTDTPTSTPTATFTPSATPTPSLGVITEDWTTLCNDEFGDQSNPCLLPIEGTYEGTDWQGTIEVANREYTVEGTRVLQTDDAVWRVFPLKKFANISDFYIKVDAKFNSSNPDNTVGLAFYSTDNTKDYYLFEFKNSGPFRKRVYIGGNGTNFEGKDWEDSNVVKSSDWNKIEILAVNQKFDIYVNDQFVTSFSDTTLGSGYLGLFVRFLKPDDRGKWEFDNLEVRVPELPPPPAEPTPSAGYTIYDDFNLDNGLWTISGNEAKCPRQLENGTLKIECFGSDTEDTDLTFFPTNPNALTARGLEMAFYTLPQPVGTNQWGKFHLQARYGLGCNRGQFPRTYYTSTRPNELTFVETDSDFQSINPPSPKRPIGTNQIHVIKIELVNGKVTYYLDNEVVRDVSPLESTSPICWMFQSDDNDNRMADGYRGIVILWIATKP